MTETPRTTNMTPEEFWRSVGEWAVEQGIWPKTEAAQDAARQRDELREALVAVLATEFSIQVSGHDVECDVAQTSGLPCSCGFSDARRRADALLRATEEKQPPDVVAITHPSWEDE